MKTYLYEISEFKSINTIKYNYTGGGKHGLYAKRTIIIKFLQKASALICNRGDQINLWIPSFYAGL